jgi:membrane peptidoglycan carboxypeptidase
VGGRPQLAAAVWFGNKTTNTLSAGFGGPTAGPIWRTFMIDALEGKDNVPLPDVAANPVCNLPGRQVDENGGRAEPVIVRPPTSQQAPTVVQDTPPVNRGNTPTVTPANPTQGTPSQNVNPGNPTQGSPNQGNNPANPGNTVNPPQLSIPQPQISIPNVGRR